MSTSKTIFHLGFTVAVTAALFVSGCAEPASEEASLAPKSESPIAQAAHENEKAADPHELVGVWWGSGVLDQASLRAAMQGLSADTQQQLSVRAETFAATEMAIEFKVDGQMETAVEVTNQSGQRESGMGVATWEASPTITPGEYRVSSEETQPNGLKMTDHKTYRVSKDGMELTLLVDLPGLLGQCNPRIVLKRQAQQDSVAAGQGEILR